MGPCHVCAKPGSFGARRERSVVWSCVAHKAALPKPGDWNYDRTEAQDREAAMREMARILVQRIGRDKVAEIGREAIEAAFVHGLEAYFAMRAHMLEPSR